MTRPLAIASAALLVTAAPAAAKLAFVRAGAIVVAGDHGGHERIVARGFGPTLSPDGRWVAFYRFHPFGDELRVVRARGGASRRLLANAFAMEPRPAVWSPDSEHVLARDGGTGAYVFNVVKHTKHRYATRGDGLGSGTFAPDGGRLLLSYGGDRELGSEHLVPLAGGPQRELWTGDNPLWSRLGIVDVDDRGVELASGPGSRPHHVAHVFGLPAAASDDGRGVLVVQESYFGEPARAVLVDPVARRWRRLPQPFDSVNGLSHDGRRVLAVLHGNVVSVSSGAKRVRVLVRNAAEPSWSR